MTTLNIPSISSPEYKAFQQCYEIIIIHIQGQLISMRISLFQKGYIDDSFLEDNNETSEAKALKLLTPLLRRIQWDTSAFHGFVDILRGRGPNGNEMAKALQQRYELELEHQQQCEPNVQQVQQPPVLDSAESLPAGFLCPYCRRCTLEEFTSEQGCPDKPPEMFPFLDVTNLLPAEKDELLYQLRSATIKIKATFSTFVLRLKCSLEERRVSLNDFKFAILSLGAFHTDDTEVPILDRDEITAVTEYSEVILCLQKYISFFNYEIIEDVVAKFGSDDDKKGWDEYIQEFNAFCKRSIFEVPPSVFSTRPQTTAKVFCAKCDEKQFTLETVLEVKGKIAKIFNLTFRALKLCSISKGCVELRFSVPASVSDRIFPISIDQRIALGNIGIQIFTDIEEIPAAAKERLDVVSKQLVDTEDHVKRSRKTETETKTAAAVNTPESLIKWSDHHGETTNGATGDRDVLIIVSKVVPTEQDPDIVPRKPKDSLSEREKKKLKEQGILSEYHDSDLSIMMERYRLDPDSSKPMVLVYEKNTPSREEVMEKVIKLMKNTNKSGIVLHYIGPGDAGTGDWCLKDGLIKFREIMELYAQYFKGRVLTIISDCSHSGRWVKEAMTFMNEYGVGPCGHAAKEKDIFIKVYTSCQPDQIPTEFAFTIHCAVTNKETGNMIYRVHLQSLLQSLIPYNYQQDPSGLDLTAIRCDNDIFESCTIAEDSNWEKWSNGERIYMIKTKDRGIDVCCYIVVDDDQHNSFMDALESGGIETMSKVHDYGHIKLSVEGKYPPIEISKYIAKNYSRYYNCGHL